MDDDDDNNNNVTYNQQRYIINKGEFTCTYYKTTFFFSLVNITFINILLNDRLYLHLTS